MQHFVDEWAIRWALGQGAGDEVARHARYIGRDDGYFTCDPGLGDGAILVLGREGMNNAQ